MDWQEHIASLRTKADISDHETALRSMVEELPAALARSIAGKKKLGVLFSGGVDSTLLCVLLRQAGIDFIAVTIGFRDNPDQLLPDDVLVARKIAAEYGFKHRELVLDFSEMEGLLRDTVRILSPDLDNVVNVGVGSVELAGARVLKGLSITNILGGLGSEEIFAGYQRHKLSDDVHEECWRGLLAMEERDLRRDRAIADAVGVVWLTPFLDKQLIRRAMRIDASLKLTEEHAKLILREAAVKLGVREEFAFRPKKAAQYGSRTDQAIGKLAKRNGFAYKKDYLASLR